jgi:hypothetical protein
LFPLTGYLGIFGQKSQQQWLGKTTSRIRAALRIRIQFIWVFCVTGGRCG